MNDGFFIPEYVLRGKKKRIKSTSAEPFIKQFDCETCGLYKNCLSPKMKYTGKGKKKILIIAEAPGREEDKQGVQLIGQSGKLFRNYLNNLGYDLDRDFWKTNSIICRPPPGNKTPTTIQLKSCRNKLLKTIEELKPKGIILLGKIAVEAVIKWRLVGRLNDVSFSDLLGECVPDQEMKTWLCPIYHPAYLLRNDYKEDLKREYKKQLSKAIETIDKSFYVHNNETEIFTTEQKEEAIKWIENLLDKKIIAFDYETTGLKPYRKGHRILSASISDGLFGYAFPFFDDSDFKEAWKKLMLSDVLKITHNLKFEKVWTKNILGYFPENLIEDTMIMQHSIYNRKPAGLKFLVYSKFGVLGFDEKVDKYMNSVKPGEDPKSANSFNKLDECLIQDLLDYNAKDSLFTYKLYEELGVGLNLHIRKGYRFFIEGQNKLAEIEMNGFCVDKEVLEEGKLDINEKLRKLEKRIRSSKQVQKWDGEKEFNFQSGKQLSHLLFDILKIETKKKTEKGNFKTDAETLGELNISFVDKILEWKKWTKVLNTYLKQYEREIVGNKINTFYHLSGVRSYRSSSRQPNMQNPIKRDPEKAAYIRKIIIPSKGNKLVEYDYKSIEVIVSACYNKDPNLIKYASDSNTDMHRDSASEIFMKSKEEITKVERYLGKNGFVFAEFYGDYFGQISPIIWKNMPKETKEHLNNKGIKKYKQFEKHVEKIERRFWGERFPVYAEWKVNQWERYLKRGVIKSYTGFKYTGMMGKNDVSNYPIQGSAFHILLWTLCKVQDQIRDNKRSRIIGETHDSLLCDLHPDDEKEFDQLILEYGTKKVREYWDWIILPLRIEKEVSEIDGNWHEMKSVGVLK